MAHPGTLLWTEFSARPDVLFGFRRRFAIGLLICLVCLVLRAYYTPLPWLDEAFTLLLADVPPPISFYLSYVYDRHGPAYFILLSLAHAATGSHFFTYYHSYLLLGVLLVLLLWPRISSFERRERLLAASLFLVMPYVLHMTNEMRMYLFQATLAWSMWLCLVAHYERPRSPLVLWLALIPALMAAYAHVVGFLIGFSALLFLAATALYPAQGMPDRRPDRAYRRDASLFAAGYLALALPAIANFLLRASQPALGTGNGAADVPAAADPLGSVQALGTLVLGSNHAMAGLLSICALLGMITVVRGTDPSVSSTIRRATCAGFVLLPVAAVMLLGFLRVSSAPRAGFYGLPFLTLTMAGWLRAVPGRRQSFLTAGIFLVLASLSLYQAMTARADQDYRALADDLATAPREQPIGFLHVIDLWMVAREMGARDVEPERFFKPLAELGPVARSRALRSLLDAAGLTQTFAWKRISAITVGGRELRLVDAGQLSSWSYDTPIVSSWGIWATSAAICQASRAGFDLFLRPQQCTP
jgi:hypothetical protein